MITTGRLFLISALFLAATEVASEIIQSDFGYSFELSDGWIYVGKSTVAERFNKKEIESLGYKGPWLTDSNIAAVTNKVNAGETEYYFLPRYSQRDQLNNIAVTRFRASLHLTNSNQRSRCAEIAREFAPGSGYPSSVRLAECNVRSVNGRAYLAYSVEGLTSWGAIFFQYQIGAGPNRTFTVSGAGSKEAAGEIRDTMNEIVNAILSDNPK